MKIKWNKKGNLIIGNKIIKEGENDIDDATWSLMGKNNIIKMHLASGNLSKIEKLEKKVAKKSKKKTEEKSEKKKFLSFKE